MTNINCALNCIYQNDGKCCYEQISISNFSKESNCAYFQEKVDLEKNNHK